MPKIKAPKGTPALDMTPMVDLAFLLVTFFMLTASSRVTEPVVVDPPASHSAKMLPQNVVLITIDPNGKVFYTINNPEVRKATLERVGTQFGITFTEKEKHEFSIMSSFGVPIKEMKKYLATESSKRPSYPTAGIPTDSTNTCELIYWIQFGWSEGNRAFLEEKSKAEAMGMQPKGEQVRFAIKADSETKYIQVRKVLDVFKKLKLFRFNLITNLEQEAGAAEGGH